MKKGILIVLFVLLCSGCSNIKYSLKFNKPIEEYMTFNDDIHEEESGSFDSMPDMSATEYLFQSLPYNSGSNADGLFYAGTFYDNVDEILDSVIFRYISEDSVKINGSKVSINISNENLIDDVNFDGLEVSLYIPYYVSKHNASSVKNNIYTWKIENIYNDKIVVSFDMSKPTDYMNKIISYFIIGGLAIVIIGVIIYFVNKNKKANEI